MIDREREAFEGDNEGYNREILGIGTYPAGDNAWLVIPEKNWIATYDKSGGDHLRKVAFGIDVTPNRDYAAISVCGVKANGNIVVYVIAHHPGTDWIVNTVKKIDAERGPAKWIIDTHAAAGSFYDALEKEKIKLEKLTATDMAHGCGQFYDGIVNTWLFHPKQKNIDKAIAGADKRKLSGQWAWDRDNSANDICPLVSATTALWGHLKFGAVKRDVKKTVHFSTNQVIRMYRAGAYGPDDIHRLIDSGLLNADQIKELHNAGVYF